MEELEKDIENKITELDPRAELIALEKEGPDGLRIFVDHPDGVDLGLCERVTRQLAELSSEYSLEVSSPGLDRPLTRPSHYQRFLGSTVRVRTREKIEGRKSFTGRLAAADEHAVSVEDDSGHHEIPLEIVHRSNLVPEFSEVSP